VSLSMPDFLMQARERIPNLAGLKFTNPDLMAYQLCLRAADGAFDAPWGCDEFLLAAAALGATGAVGSTYNFAAPIYHRVLKAFAAGDLKTARDEQFRAVQMIQLIVRHGFMGATKAMMSMLGIDVGPARLPNVTLTSDQIQTLRRELEALGFFEWL
jgi:N-acetylneuraminate lyase